MPGVPGSAVNEMIEMALRKRWLLQGGFRYMGYGLPQPVTSVTGFAMTGFLQEVRQMPGGGVRCKQGVGSGGFFVANFGFLLHLSLRILYFLI